MQHAGINSGTGKDSSVQGQPPQHHTTPQPARHICQKEILGEDDRKTCSLSESVPEGCFRQFTTFVRLQLDYICFHLTD